MNVRIEASSSYDLPFACNNIRARTNDQIGMDSFHDIRVTGLANTYDVAILDTDISLVDT